MYKYVPNSCLCCIQKWHRKRNTVASYATKKIGIEYQGFLLHFCTHRYEFYCVFGSKKLSKYTICSLIWGYELHVRYFQSMNLNMLQQYMNLQYLYEWICMYHGQWVITITHIEHFVLSLDNKANVRLLLWITCPRIQNLNKLHLSMNLQYLYEWVCMQDGHWVITIAHIEHFVLS